MDYIGCSLSLLLCQISFHSHDPAKRIGSFAPHTYIDACASQKTKIARRGALGRKRQISRDDTPRGPAARVIELVRIVPAIEHHDVRVARVDAVPPQAPGGAGDAGLVGDAVGAAHRGRAVVARGHLAVEEGPEGRGVEVQVGAADDVLRQAHAAGLVPVGAPAEIRVAVPRLRRPGVRGVLPRADALPVGGFRLLHAGVDVFGAVQVVVV